MTQPITNALKLLELKREIGMRRKVYPRFIETGRMTASEADNRNRILAAIILDYEQLANNDRLHGDLFG